MQDDVFVVGRICGEADASAISSSSKLAEGSIFLESSRSMGSGLFRVALRFEPNLKLRGVPEGSGSLSIFPGAIVALKGKNGSGSCFVVSEMLALPCPPNAQEPSSHKTFSMAIACGPFTNDSDLEFKPLSSLVEKLSSSRPCSKVPSLMPITRYCEKANLMRLRPRFSQTALPNPYCLSSARHQVV